MQRKVKKHALAGGGIRGLPVLRIFSNDLGAQVQSSSSRSSSKEEHEGRENEVEGKPKSTDPVLVSKLEILHFTEGWNPVCRSRSVNRAPCHSCVLLGWRCTSSFLS